MAIIHADDFSLYRNLADMLQGIWGSGAGAVSSSPDPLDTAARKTLYNLNAQTTVLPLPGTPRPSVGVGFRFWRTELPSVPPSSSEQLIGFRDAMGVAHCRLQIGPAGQLNVVLNGATIGATPPGTVTAAAFHHVEMLCTPHGVTGKIEVRLNGLTVINFTGNTLGPGANADVSILYFGSGGTGGAAYIKDLVIWDSTGTRNNSFLGSVLVKAMPVVSDISVPWTKSTGTTGFNLVNGLPIADTNYISAAASPLPGVAEFEMSDLPPDVVTVKGIVVLARARKTDGGDGNIQVSLRKSGSVLNGADRPITTAFTFWRDVFETDPATGGAITPANFNLMSLGINRTI